MRCGSGDASAPVAEQVDLRCERQQLFVGPSARYVAEQVDVAGRSREREVQTAANGGRVQDEWKAGRSAPKVWRDTPERSDQTGDVLVGTPIYDIHVERGTG